MDGRCDAVLYNVISLVSDVGIYRVYIQNVSTVCPIKGGENLRVRRKYIFIITTLMQHIALMQV